MAIATGDAYIASAKQIVPFTKTASTTTIATTRFSVFDKAGNPGAGTLALTTALTGSVEASGTAGYPSLTTFGGGATGYLSRVAFASSVVGRIELWDRLFGINVSLAALATTTLSGAGSYLGRVPGGTSAVGTRLFAEFTTAAAAASTITVTYTNQAGTAARTTGASASVSGFTVNRLLELPLQAGDSGVNSIQTVVVGGTAGAGAVNIIVLRPLWTGRINIANGADIHGPDKTGMPVVFATSALYLTTIADSTSSGVPDLNIEIANG